MVLLKLGESQDFNKNGKFCFPERMLEFWRRNFFGGVFLANLTI